MSGQESGERSRTPWWFHLMLGFIGLSASVTYVRAALMSPGGDSRSWLIAVVWAVFGGLWIVFALLGRARSR